MRRDGCGVKNLRFQVPDLIRFVDNGPSGKEPTQERCWGARLAGLHSPQGDQELTLQLSVDDANAKFFFFFCIF